MSRYFTRSKKLLDTYGGYKERRRMEFESNVSALTPLPGPANEGGPVEFEAERLRPSRAPSLESDVLVPAGWAVGLGVLAFGITVYLSIVSDFAWHAGCLASMITMAIVVMVSVGILQKTMWMAERISHVDLDGDDEIGPPTVELGVSVRDDQDRQRKMYIADVGVEPDKLLKFCEGVLGGKGLAVGAWTGKNNLFSRNEYDRLMSELERSQMVQRDGSGTTAPRVLTDAGRQAFKQLVLEGI